MTDQEQAPEATEAPQPEVPTPQATDATAELEALRAKYERAQKDLAKFRTRAEEVEAAKKAAEEKALAEADAAKRADMLAAKVAELEKAAAEAAARAAAAERRAALTGKVADVELALAVADKFATEGGNLDIDALLKAHPTLKAGNGAPSTPGAAGNLPSKTTRIAALQDQLKTARTMAERVAIERQLHQLQKG